MVEKVVGNRNKVHATAGTGCQKHPSEATEGDVSSSDWCFWLRTRTWFLRQSRARAQRGPRRAHWIGLEGQGHEAAARDEGPGWDRSLRAGLQAAGQRWLRAAEQSALERSMRVLLPALPGTSGAQHRDCSQLTSGVLGRSHPAHFINCYFLQLLSLMYFIFL